LDPSAKIHNNAWTEAEFAVGRSNQGRKAHPKKAGARNTDGMNAATGKTTGSYK